MSTANRLADRIALIQKRIDSGVATKEQMDRLDKQLHTSWADLVMYQDLQAQAHAAGKLTTEEADLVYRLLGRDSPSEEKWDKLTLAEKTALTQLMSELLDWRIKSGGGFAAAPVAVTRKRKKTVHRQPRRSGGEPGLGYVRR